MRVIKIVLFIFMSLCFSASFAQNYEQMARQMGISSGQIESFKNQNNGGQAISANSIIYEGDDRTRTTNANNSTPTNQISSSDLQDRELIANKSKLSSDELRKLRFGADIFKKTNLSFEPNLNIATSTNYVLAAGDEIIIDVWGASEKIYKLTISPEGTVFIPNIGVVNLSSLSVKQAEVKLLKALSEIYSGVDGANVKINVAVGKMRSVKVNVAGEVIKPGTYMLPSVATLFNVLYMAGGVNDIGSLRDIKLYRDGNLITSLDVYEYITKGLSASNVRLQDNDMVIVEPYKNLIATKGSLKRERVYELKDGETLKDLLQYAGGFSGDAFTEKVTVSRKDGDRYQISTVYADNFSLFKMKDGDMLEVEKTIPLFHNRVSVSGAVWREGNYELTPKTSSIRSIIESAGGLKGDAFTNRGQITRQLPDYSFEIIAIDIKKILSGEILDVALKNNDKVYIPSIYDIKEKQYIKVFGEVNFPKLTKEEIELRRRRTTLQREMRMQQLDTSVLSTNNYSTSENQDVNNDIYSKKYEFQVDDSLYVDRGYVNTFPYRKGMTISDAILLAGGMKESASEAKIVVARRMKNSTSLSALNNIATEFQFPISVDLKLDEKGAEFVLEPFDEVFVRKSPGYVSQRRVKILGEVAFPGDYVLTKTGERLSSVIARSGGYTPDAYINGTRLVRVKSDSEIKRERVTKITEINNNIKRKAVTAQNAADAVTKELREEDIKIDSLYTVGIDMEKAIKNPGTFSDPVLREGDIIVIPEVTNVVKISGAVLYPNTVSFNGSKKYKYYIDNAGGYVPRARRKPYIIYMNGTVALARKGAKIEPGCEIVVPMKIDPTNPIGVQGWVTMATSLTSMAAMVTSIVK